MRIRALELLAFGPFSDRILELEGNGPHLVFGPNEAGKSSALRALNAFFFGIPLRTDDDFIHGKPKLRVGMRIESEQGSPLHLHRIKRQKDTLLDAADGKVVKDVILSRLLGGLSGELFQSLYGLDHAGLEQGAAELLHGRGELGSALFAAGSGLVRLYQVQQDLDARISELYKPSGRKNLIPLQQKQFTELRQQIREVQAGSEEWEGHLRAREEAEKEKHELDAELQQVLKEKNQLERIRDALPDIVLRTELLVEKELLAGVRALPEEFAEQRQNAVTAQRIAMDQCEQLRKELDALDQELAALHPPSSLLDAGETILRLSKDLNRIRSQRVELLELRHSLTGVRERIQELTQVLPKSLAQNQSQVVVDRGLETRIGKLIDSGARLQAEKEQGKALLEQRSQELQQTRNGLEALAASRDLSGLAVSVETLTQHGDVEMRLSEAEQDNLQRMQVIRHAISRQARWSGAPEALSGLALPDESLIDAQQTEQQQALAARTRLEDELRQIRADLVQIHADMEALGGGDAIPDEEELLRTRRRRDAGWELVLAAWEQGIPPGTTNEAGQAFVAACAGAAGLPQAYAQSVGEADTLSDRLRREAGRVASFAALKSRLQVALAAEAETLARLERMAEEQARNAESWQAIWLPLGITPGSPQEMRLWARQISDLTRQAGELEQGRARVQQLSAQLRGMRATLIERMLEAGFPEPDRGTGFAELLGFCRKKVQELQKLEQQRTHLDEQQRTLAARLARQQQSVRTLEEKHQNWQCAWADSVSALGLDGRAYPEEARDVLNLLRELHGLRKRMADELSRRDFLTGSLEKFAVESRELVTRIAPELVPEALLEDRLPELDNALEELEARLSRARQAAALRKEAQKRREKAERRLQQVEQDAAQAESQLRSLCELAECASAEDLGGALERSNRLRQCLARLEETEDRLRRQSMGLSLEEFVRNALNQDADLLAPRLELLESRTRELHERRSVLDRTIGSEQAALARMRGEDDAARLADDAEGVLAGMAQSVEDYISLLIARKMLHQAMESYRDKVQGGIVRQAGDYFKRITLESFCGVRVENLGPGETLVGVRTPASAGLSVEAMSSGSRDQLFLALRLASLSALLDDAEPTPLILDDILVNFDDQRATETLRLLRELSQRTQVIYFTHHLHIRELAEGWLQHRL